MFNWICPQCGREVLPSYTECPDCSKQTPAGAPGATAGNPAGPSAPPQAWGGPAQPPAYAPPPPANFPPQQPPEPVYQQAPPQPVYQQAPPQQPVYQQPPQQPVYQQPAYQQSSYQQPVYQQPPAYQPPQPPPQYAARRPRAQGGTGFLHGMPTWLLTVLFAVVFGAVGMALYWWLGSSNGNGSAAATTPPSTVENPAAKAGAKTNPLQKYVEISGVRFTEDAKKNISVKFMVTNHSDSDLSGLTGNATIWARTQKSEEDSVGTFSFTTDVGPEAVKEVSAPLTTKLKIYELPDWQNVTTDLQITSPQ